MKNKQFEIGKTYFSRTRAGVVRLFKVTNILKRKSTGERVFVVASYDGKPEERYEIRTLASGCEIVDIDKRFCTIIDTTEYIKAYRKDEVNGKRITEEGKQNLPQKDESAHT